MPSNVQALVQMADHAATQISASHESWTDFLRTAARLYKYPYHEQLMIYAQRPDATACAGYELWNEKMRRYVRRGSRGVALIDASGDRPRIRYVFDVSDTGSRDDSRRRTFGSIVRSMRTRLRRRWNRSTKFPVKKAFPTNWSRSPGSWRTNIGRRINTTFSTSLTAAS